MKKKETVEERRHRNGLETVVKMGDLAENNTRATVERASKAAGLSTTVAKLGLEGIQSNAALRTALENQDINPTKVAHALGKLLDAKIIKMDRYGEAVYVDDNNTILRAIELWARIVGAFAPKESYTFSLEGDLREKVKTLSDEDLAAPIVVSETEGADGSTP